MAVHERLVEQPAVWERMGDLAAYAMQAWVALHVGENALVKEAMAGKLGALRAELLGPAPTALERLLVEGIGACWLQVQYADRQAAAFEQKGERCAGESTGRSSRTRRTAGISQPSARWRRCGDC